MTTITIPKILSGRQKHKLVAVPSEDYKEFLTWQKEQKHLRQFKTFTPTAAEKKELARARKNFAQGKYIKWSDLKHELGLAG
ncbi:MAG: hypothetical protein HY481_00105 [Candidatus Vogelbacteria bacterium]|nr:hypothetical protein [Candidatus Vogelbacteria bacterium]